MQRVTIRLDEETARWAEAEASRQGMTLSHWLRDLLRSRMISERAYREAEEQFFSIEPRPPGRPGERAPRRDAL